MDEIMVRLDILQNAGIFIPDPYAYEICNLSGQAFEALMSAIRQSHTETILAQPQRARRQLTPLQPASA